MPVQVCTDVRNRNDKSLANPSLAGYDSYSLPPNSGAQVNRALEGGLGSATGDCFADRRWGVFASPTSQRIPETISFLEVAKIS